MADTDMTPTTNVPLVPQTDPSAKGMSTSEGKMAAAMTALCFLGTVVPTLMTMLTDIKTNFPGWGWTGPAIGIVSILAGALTSLGYMNKRTELKLGLIDSGKKIAVLLLLLGATNASASPLVLCLQNCEPQVRMMKAVSPDSTVPVVETAPAPNLWFGPAVGLNAFTRFSADNAWQAGVIPGIGYGINWKPASWTVTSSLIGLNFYLQAAMSKAGNGPSTFNIDVLPVLTFMDLLAVGYGHRFMLATEAGQKDTGGVLLTVGILKTIGTP
jgi:hypothetical protein